MRSRFGLLFALSAILSFAGCFGCKSDSDTAENSGTGAAAGSGTGKCSAGAVGCECREGGACDSAIGTTVECVMGVCISCGLLGGDAEGCPCSEGGLSDCNFDADLQCVDGGCVPCPPGDLDCACVDGACSDPAHVCASDRCRVAGSCCETQLAGCDEPAVRECVCGTTPQCCDEWSSDCVVTAVRDCGATCAGPDSCCLERPTPGCEDISIQSCVCGTVAACCNVAWTSDCVDEVVACVADFDDPC